MSAGNVRIAVLQFPGTNCEYETASVIKAAGMEPEIFRWNRPPEELSQFDGYVIPGGFSYQDRVRAGAVAAKKSVCTALVQAAAEGKPILGICNGAQILIETGLVPGQETEMVEMALAENRVEGRSGYHCDWVYIRAEQNSTYAFSRLFDGKEVIPIPVAHAEGRFVTSDESVLDAIMANKQIGFRYCTANGKVVELFPVNPNGAQLNIAGLYNKGGNVLALMPHPERGAWKRQVPMDLPGAVVSRDLTTLREDGPGMTFFHSMREYILERRTQ